MFDALKKYADFNGRARRQEYWLFFLLNIILFFAVTILTAFSEIFGILYFYTLGFIIPSIAVTVRRLHDINRSGLWLFLALVPLIGPIVLFIWYVTDGTPGDNDYGPDPKGRNSQ